MITKEKRGKIESLAQKLHNKSEEYQLAHGTLGAAYFLKDEFKKMMSNNICDELAIRLQAESFSGSKRKEAEEKAENLKKSVGKPMGVRVEYFTSNYGGGGRALKQDDEYLIELPGYLRDSCTKKENNRYDVRAIKVLREEVAHELGHILLHRRDIPDGTQGTKILNSSHDEEANYFKNIFIKLRNERAKQILHDGGYHKPPDGDS